MTRLELDVLATIEEHSMLAAGERVAVACSGGADSTALLHVLLALGRRFGWVVSLAHFNHQLRSAESDADAAAVRALAAANSLDLHEASADVRAHAGRAHANLEATARQLRYDFLRSLTASGKADRIAVGHTADDQAETVLLRLLRGTGPQGLAAIRPTLPGGIIRPLIAVRGGAVRAWLRKRVIGWREDSSNADLRLRRNLVRSKLLPALEQVNPSVVQALAQTAALAQADDDFWQRYVRHLADKHLRVQGNRISIGLAALRRLPRAAVLRLLKRALGLLLADEATKLHRPERPGFLFPHLMTLHDWAFAAPSSCGSRRTRGIALALPKNIEARCNGKHLILLRAKQLLPAVAAQRASEYHLPLTPPCELAIPLAGLCLRFEFIAPGQNGAAYNGDGQVLLDGSKLKFPLTLRNWQPGDAYHRAGHLKSRKLKELFGRHRVPIERRAHWPVLESGGRIVWTWQFGTAEGFAAAPQVPTALLVTVREETASKE